MAEHPSTSSSSTNSLPQHEGGSHSDLPKRVRAQERAYQSEMMFIGQRCHWHECSLEDFLPFRCADCRQTFCSHHFRTQQHACPTPTPTFIVPLCPLCHEPPKQWKRDEDPNVAMDAHLTPNRQGIVECQAIAKDGSLRASSAQAPRAKRENECGERRCKKLMVVPIQCPSCRLHFCPSHRAAVQHDCVGPKGAAARNGTTTKAGTGKTQSPGAKLLDSLAAKRDALQQKQQQQPQEASSSLSKKNEPTTETAKSNPIKAIQTATSQRKMDKRAKNEQSSAIQAMQARQKKGLLTPAEQVRLAEEMAHAHVASSKDKGKPDCTIS